MLDLTWRIEELKQRYFVDIPGRKSSRGYRIMHRELMTTDGKSLFYSEWSEIPEVLSWLENTYHAKFFIPSTARLEVAVKILPKALTGSIYLSQIVPTSSVFFVPDSGGEYSPRVDPRLPKGRHGKLVHDVVRKLVGNNVVYEIDENKVVDFPSLSLFTGMKYVRGWSDEDGFPTSVGDTPSEKYLHAPMYMDCDFSSGFGERLVGRIWNFTTHVELPPSNSKWCLRLATEGILRVPEKRA